jgi:uncharacterized protein
MPTAQQINEVEIAIVGAGPAGLAAAHACLARGNTFLIIETGPSSTQRSVESPEQVLHGIGGAGLYSDGKLSYFPAAHQLWSLPSTSTLQKAFSWLNTLMGDFLENPPEFPDLMLPPNWHQPTHAQKFAAKHYAATILTDKHRQLLLTRLLGAIQHRILTQARVENITRSKTGFTLGLREVHSNTPPREIRAQQVIYCGGRFGALDLIKLLPNIPNTFVRFEYGVRIEQSASDFCLRHSESKDTKLISTSHDLALEWRTFCECRTGTVILCQHGGLRAYSGFSSESSRSANVGFMARLLSPTLYASCRTEAERLLQGQMDPQVWSLLEFQRLLARGAMFGPLLDARLKEGLDTFTSQFRINTASVYAPCVEGTGFYPWTTAHLQTAIPGLHIAGDCVGQFRGLLAAFLSGFYVGDRASVAQLESEDRLRPGFHIKRSPISPMPMVFTAQSKTVFYCRDAICEFVLKRGSLPLNPFRVFDYFLSDRVDHALVRRGNNQLIKACDEIWVFGPVADGVLFEVIYALEIGKPIRFFTVGAKAEDITEINELSRVTFESEVHAPGITRESLLKSVETAFERRHALRNEGELPL